MIEPQVSANLVGGPATAGTRPPPDRPLQEVVLGLWENTEKLVRQELALAGAELDQKLQRLKLEAIATLAGAGVLLLGLSCAVAALVLLLSKVMDPFLAALVVAVVLSGAGYLLISRKKPQLSELTPERTIENVQKDVETFTEAKP
jgi:hypothetical protein